MVYVQVRTSLVSDVASNRLKHHWNRKQNVLKNIKEGKRMVLIL